MEGLDHLVAVGRDTPDGDPVPAILEASGLGPDLYLLCTPRAVLTDMPCSLALDERWRVIDFDEEGAGGGLTPQPRVEPRARNGCRQ